MTPQLSLFHPNFDQRIRRVVVDGVMHFSVLDVFQHYGSDGSASNPAMYWKRVEKRIRKQGGEVITGLLSHRFEGQGQRNTPVATFKTFMRIVQVSEIREWEYLRDWMAGLAQERVEETANPALGVDRAHQRFIDTKMAQGMSKAEALRSLALQIESTEKRNDLTDSLKAVCIEELARFQYAQATNTQYENLFDMSAKEISEATGQRVAKNGLTDIGRQILMLSDMTVTEIFRARGRMTYAQALEVVRGVCADYGLNVRNIEARLGISLVTGKPLLPAHR